MVDTTGGRPVVDLLRRADPGCAMYPVMITAGRRNTPRADTTMCRNGTRHWQHPFLWY